MRLRIFRMPSALGCNFWKENEYSFMMLSLALNGTWHIVGPLYIWLKEYRHTFSIILCIYVCGVHTCIYVNLRDRRLTLDVILQEWPTFCCLFILRQVLTTEPCLAWNSLWRPGLFSPWGAYSLPTTSPVHLVSETGLFSSLKLTDETKQAGQPASPRKSTFPGHLSLRVQVCTTINEYWGSNLDPWIFLFSVIFPTQIFS